MTRPTQIILVRHGHSTANAKGVLAGQDKSVGLTERGHQEAELLADYLSQGMSQGVKISRVVTSPLLRARETIAPFIKRHPAIEVLKDSGIIEMNYGSWSGKKISSLAQRPLWREIQHHPSSVRFPEGESFLEMSSRSSESVRELALKGKTTLFVSHGDVIKSILAHHLGLHLDQFQRIAIEPASVSMITVHPHGSLVTLLNSTAHFLKHKSTTINSTLGGGSGSSAKLDKRRTR